MSFACELVGGLCEVMELGPVVYDAQAVYFSVVLVERLVCATFA